MEELKNLFWGGLDGSERHLNIYSRVLSRLKEEVEKDKIGEGLFTKIEAIYAGISQEYFKDHFGANLFRLNKELGVLHDNFKEKITPDLFIQSEFLGFTDNGCELISRLVESGLENEEVKALTKNAFDSWAETGKLGKPDELRFPDNEDKGIPHINSANDYMGSQIYDKFKEKIKLGEEIKILDLGAGYGGTAESIIHWIYTCAERDGIERSKINITLDAVEFNDILAAGLNIKKDKLKEKYRNTKINIIKADAQEYVAQKAVSLDEEYDVVDASYMMHHLLNKDKADVLKNSNKITKKDGMFLWADPNQGKSQINKRFFNFTDEGTFASFLSPEEAVKLIENAGYKAIDVISNPNCKSTIVSLIGEQKYNVLSDNYNNFNGYVCVGVKQ